MNKVLEFDNIKHELVILTDNNSKRLMKYHRCSSNYAQIDFNAATSLAKRKGN